ncbi:hypothetical protein N0V93_006059 [Gnomoniopsis smithogilvyi]|uniref:Protein kinase domain-containing protein n=1 Tax=Gnomoniopsis smithogilvyi TaxID=1191159 RepID=A0A9W8YQ27_9PEZI|nr:hypothetical protein N0V93_006059 [Gnomoniopsis smithogilvyi]
MEVQRDSGINGNLDCLLNGSGNGPKIAANSAATLPVSLSMSGDDLDNREAHQQYPVQLQRRGEYAEILEDNGSVHSLSSSASQLETSASSSKNELSEDTTIPTSRKATLATDVGVPVDTLERLIRACFQTSVGNSNRDKFLPDGELNQIITLDRVFAELDRSFQPKKSPDDLQRLSHQVWDEVEVPESPSTHRRKIFATLVCINKAADITWFIDENLYDCHLPFHLSEIPQQESQVHRKTKTGDEVQIHCFSKMGWSVLDNENCQKYQWSFQAPYLRIMSDGQRQRPLHYRFDDRQILPFIEDSEEKGASGQMMMSGGFSEVWRVRIHPAHHSHPSSKNPLFAVKRLKPDTRNEEMFKREVATLKRLSGQNHAHLIKLQLTYLYRNRYHLLFRWADGNLRRYWEVHPDPSDIPRTWEYTVWVASQWLGLARGLHAIHHCPPDDDMDIEEDKLHDVLEFLRINGRHGDIKPENILWSQSPDLQNEKDSAHGRLVISDFGLTEFHRDETNFVSPLKIAMSPTYRPPEYDVSEEISQSYDIWSLGCVLLEFAIWYLQGFDAFDRFSQDRTSEDFAIIKEDKYFTIAHNLQLGNGMTSSAAVLKASVTRGSQTSS